MAAKPLILIIVLVLLLLLVLDSILEVEATSIPIAEAWRLRQFKSTSRRFFIGLSINTGAAPMAIATAIM
jgi:hypothetical protein